MQTEKVYPSNNSFGNRPTDGRSQVAAAAAKAERASRVRPPLEPTTPQKASQLRALMDGSRGGSAGAQCARLLLAMRQIGEVSRIEAERFLGIGHAPRRILDLEESGHLIGKRWVRQLAESGSEHRTVAYSLAFDAGLAP